MISDHAQPRILAGQQAVGRSLTFRLRLEADPRPALRRLAEDFDINTGMLGLGAPLLGALGAEVPGLRPFPALAGPAVSVPSTQGALWIFQQAADRSALFDQVAMLQWLIDDAFELVDSVETFTYAGGRDLSGYVDGTANPDAAEAPEVALVAQGAGLAGSSFVAVQRWVHDLARFRSHGRDERDAMIGRRHADNEEIADAPAWAHVKRSAREEFDPPAVMLRRSMPFAEPRECGLEFIAFSRSLDDFERVLRRMAGLDDGIADALFRFSRPVAGSYYWCPPVAAGRLDLARAGAAVQW